MIKYCLGFAFNWNRSEVILIEKNRPDWQKGHLNGVGGKVEIGEGPGMAMRREFKEETGLETSIDQWHLVSTVYYPGCQVDVFTTMLAPSNFCNAQTTTDEVVMLVSLKDVPPLALTNIPALIQLCQENWLWRHKP